MKCEGSQRWEFYMVRLKVSSFLGKSVNGCMASKEGLDMCWASQAREAGGFFPSWQDLKWVPSSPVPTPVLPHHTPMELQGDIPLIPKAGQAPPGCIFLANYLLFSWDLQTLYFPSTKIAVSQLFDYNSATDPVCFILWLALYNAMIVKAWAGTEARAVKRFPEHKFFTAMQLMVSSILSWLMRFNCIPKPQGLSLTLCGWRTWSLVDGLLVIMGSIPWSWIGFPGPGLHSTLVLSQQSQGRHFPIWEEGPDFLPWVCRCFRNLSLKTWWSCAPCIPKFLPPTSSHVPCLVSLSHTQISR